MFILATSIGTYSYLIYFLGISGNLNFPSIIFVTLGWLFIYSVFVKLDFSMFKLPLKSSKDKLLFGILFLLIAVNLVGAIGPELSFDALWYHLTLPKIFLQTNKISFLEGGLFYYSVMPKSIEMLYMPALLFGNEIIAKIIHFSFGLLSLLVLYKLSRIFLDKTYSLFVLIVFYSNLVISWLSITAYIDLGRTFFEISALLFLILGLKIKNNGNYYKSGILLGMSVASKVLSFVSLPIYVITMVTAHVKLKQIYPFVLMAFIIPLPWFVLAYINTGNPVYPFFSPVYPISPSTSLPDSLLNFIRNPDPISPIYLITLPLIIAVYSKFSKLEKYLLLYCVLAFIVWLFTPQTGGGRFITPYLPAFSLVALITISKVNIVLVRKSVLIAIIIVSLVTGFYRGVANMKYIPVIIGQQSKQEFLVKNLNYNFGDFYDIDGVITKTVKSEDRALVIGGHNLFYLDIPFVHESYLSEEDFFNYILVIDSKLPKKYSSWKLIYENEKTNVKLYSITSL